MTFGFAQFASGLITFFSFWFCLWCTFILPVCIWLWCLCYIDMTIFVRPGSCFSTNMKLYLKHFTLCVYVGVDSVIKAWGAVLMQWSVLWRVSSDRSSLDVGVCLCILGRLVSQIYNTASHTDTPLSMANWFYLLHFTLSNVYEKTTKTLYTKQDRS